LPEVHLAVGYYRYYVQRDFTGALTELQQAEQALPNDSDIVKTIAFIQRRLGHWEEALRGLRRAIELDPRDIDGYHNLALTYEALRRFPEALATVDRALAWELMDRRSEDLLRMKVDILLATGELQALGSAPGETADMTRFISAGHALLERRYADAQDILSRALANKSVAMSSTDAIENRGTLLVVLGLTQQRAGDLDAARATYQQVLQNARHILEATSPGSSAEAEAHANLGWAYAGLSERESAIAEGQRAMAIIPSSKDLFLGPKYEENMARIYALLGDAEHAIPILKRLLHIPYLVPLTPAKLRTNPTLEGISNDLRFQELIAEATR
jgi:tetratricopeptide (TPR) repeat protein